MINYNLNVYRDSANHQRVTFGPHQYGKDKGIKKGVRILESTTCWQKLVLYFQKNIFRRVAELQDVNGQTVHIYKYKLNKCVTRHLGKKLKGNYAKNINKICNVSHLSSSPTTTKVKKTIESVSLPHSTETPLTTIIHSGNGLQDLYKAALHEKLNSRKGSAESSNTDSFQSFEESIEDLPLPEMKLDRLGSSKGSEDSNSVVQKLEELQTSVVSEDSNVQSNTANTSPKPVKHLISKSLLNRKIAAIAEAHLSAFAEMCYNSDGKLNNEIERRKAIKNPWGTTGVSPEKIRKKAEETRQKSITCPEQFEKLQMEANTLEQRANELEQDLEDTIMNLQKTFFPCRVDFEDVEEEAFVKDGSKEFSEKQFVYHGTTSESAEIIRTTKAFLTETQKEQDSGSGAYFALEMDHALDYAENKSEDNVLTCSITLGKVAHIKHDGVLWALVRNFFQMAQIYTSDRIIEISDELQTAGITENKVDVLSSEITILREHLRNKITRLYFTKMGYDSVYSPLSPRAGYIPYFNVLHPTEENVTILS